MQGMENMLKAMVANMFASRGVKLADVEATAKWLLENALAHMSAQEERVEKFEAAITENVDGALVNVIHTLQQRVTELETLISAHGLDRRSE